MLAAGMFCTPLAPVLPRCPTMVTAGTKPALLPMLSQYVPALRVRAGVKFTSIWRMRRWVLGSVVPGLLLKMR
ncbi:hypothetical protein J4558_18805 [Leptolyngbya sp. 15MV]|nr:hypothetical protein J4558_18805 [Leptolyngbya sp. 15MV]